MGEAREAPAGDTFCHDERVSCWCLLRLSSCEGVGDGYNAAVGKVQVLKTVVLSVCVLVLVLNSLTSVEVDLIVDR